MVAIEQIHQNLLFNSILFNKKMDLTKTATDICDNKFAISLKNDTYYSIEQLRVIMDTIEEVISYKDYQDILVSYDENDNINFKF